MGFKKNISYYFVGSVISKGISFILVPIYISSMSTAEYGIVGSMLVIINVLALFISLGMERSIYRLYHDYGDEEKKKEFLGSVNFFIFIFGTFILLLLFIFHDPISKIYRSIPFSPYFALAFFIAYTSIFCVVPKIYLQVVEKANIFMIVSVCQTIINAFWILFFTVYRKDAAQGYLKGCLIANMCTIPFFLWFQFRVFKPILKKEYILPTLKFCLPMLPALLSGWIISMSSQIFIENNFSTSEVAIYSLSLKIVSLVSIIFAAFFTAYTPIFYKLANDDNQMESKNYLKKVQNSIILISIIVASSIAVFSKDILVLFFPHDYYASLDIIGILVLGTIICQVNGFLNLSCYQNKKTAVIMWITLASAAITIVCNYFLVPRFSVYGAAITYAISSCFLFFITYIYAKKQYYVPFKWGLIIVSFVILISLFFVNKLFLPVSYFVTIIKTILYLIVVYICYKRYKRLLLENA